MYFHSKGFRLFLFSFVCVAFGIYVGEMSIGVSIEGVYGRGNG